MDNVQINKIQKLEKDAGSFDQKCSAGKEKCLGKTCTVYGILASIGPGIREYLGQNM
jgi:hypothetical protein